MEEVTNDINACIATLKQYLEKTYQLIKEYEQKVRKSNYSYPVEKLVHKISFSEIRRLDLLCVDTLKRYFGEDSSLVKDWFINKDVGVSSPEDLARELNHKLVILEYAKNLLLGRTAETVPPPVRISGQIRESEGFQIPKGYEKLQGSCINFFADKTNNCSDYGKNVFIPNYAVRG